MTLLITKLVKVSVPFFYQYVLDTLGTGAMSAPPWLSSGIHVCVCFVSVCVRTCVCVCVCKCACACVYITFQFDQHCSLLVIITPVYIYICMHTCTLPCVCVFACMYIYAYSYIHVYNDISI